MKSGWNANLQGAVTSEAPVLPHLHFREKLLTVSPREYCKRLTATLQEMALAEGQQ